MAGLKGEGNMSTSISRPILVVDIKFYTVSFLKSKQNALVEENAWANENPDGKTESIVL